jgi:hypothetical protein
MRIAKPLLKVSTPIGMIWGLFEGYRIVGGLVFLMALMMGVVGAGVAFVLSVVRRERAAGLARANH